MSRRYKALVLLWQVRKRRTDECSEFFFKTKVCDERLKERDITFYEQTDQLQLRICEPAELHMHHRLKSSLSSTPHFAS